VEGREGVPERVGTKMFEGVFEPDGDFVPVRVREPVLVTEPEGDLDGVSVPVLVGVWEGVREEVPEKVPVPVTVIVEDTVIVFVTVTVPELDTVPELLTVPVGEKELEGEGDEEARVPVKTMPHPQYEPQSYL